MNISDFRITYRAPNPHSPECGYCTIFVKHVISDLTFKSKCTAPLQELLNKLDTLISSFDWECRPFANDTEELFFTIYLGGKLKDEPASSWQAVFIEAKRIIEENAATLKAALQAI